MKPLLVGDIHVKKDNIEETRPIFARILELSKSHDCVLIEGDIYDRHGVLQSDEIEIVYDFFEELKITCPNSLYILGNHELLSNQKNHSLYHHKHQIKVVEKPEIFTIKNETFGAIQYIKDKETFEKEAQILLQPGVKTIFCHQEFQGGKFENNFYCPNGANPD